jgi:hypothetical protein
MCHSFSPTNAARRAATLKNPDGIIHVPDSFSPTNAARRAATMQNSELQWHKTPQFQSHECGAARCNSDCVTRSNFTVASFSPTNAARRAATP